MGIMRKMLAKFTTPDVNKDDTSTDTNNSLRLLNKARGSSGKTISDETLSKLKGRTGIKVWNRIRLSDDGVKRCSRHYKIPIEQAKITVEAGIPGDEQSELRAEHTLKALFAFNNKTAKDVLRDILLHMDHGHAVFEPEKTVAVVPGFKDPKYVISNWGWRNPLTLTDWTIKNGKVVEILQNYYDEAEKKYKVATLKGKNLMIFTNEREGDNFRGESIWRPIYGNVYRKEGYHKLMVIGLEKTAMGILHLKAPLGKENSPEIEAAKKFMRDYCTSEELYVITPTGADFEVIKVPFDADKVRGAIDGENMDMLKSMMLEHAELGVSGTGSHALGKTKESVHVRKMMYVSDYISDIINQYLIKPLEILNWGEQEEYSKFTFEGVAALASLEEAQALKELIDSKALIVDKSVRDKVRKDWNYSEEEEWIEEAEEKAREAGQTGMDALAQAGNVNNNNSNVNKKVTPGKEEKPEDSKAPAEEEVGKDLSMTYDEIMADIKNLAKSEDIKQNAVFSDLVDDYNRMVKSRLSVTVDKYLADVKRALKNGTPISKIALSGIDNFKKGVNMMMARASSDGYDSVLKAIEAAHAEAALIVDEIEEEGQIN